jgi:hypothetical protein
MKRFMDFREKRIDEAEPVQQQASPQPKEAPKEPVEAPKAEPQDAPKEEKPKSLRETLADKIKPQMESALSIVNGIQTAFQDRCANTTKYDAMGDQIKNFEKQIRGACEQVIAMVEQEKFDWKNWDNCSPKSYNVITKYKDRDFDVLKLSAAVIVFYNSLIGKN